MRQKIGKYQIVDRVGAGAMGEVYKAYDPMLKRSVALKVFSSNVEVTKELRARFFQEAQAGAMLSHPNIVTVHDLGEEDGCLFIVMELLEGEELRQLITRRRNIALEEKLTVMVEVCKGVEYAHEKGVIHRDIKPGNIFVLTNGHVKLLDFGVARLATVDTGLTRAGLIMGTLRYMSPEQCRGRADHRSDIFSVGAVFYELLTYRQAFTGDDTFGLLEQVQHAEPPPLMEVDPRLPEPLGSAIHRALRKDPAARFASIRDMRLELERTQQQLFVEADRARSRLRSRLLEVQTLEQAVAQSSGADVGPAVTLDDSGSRTSLERLEAELAARVDRLQSQLKLAQGLEPSLEHAARLTRAGDYDSAIAVFQRILVDMPDHARATEGLRHARDQQRRRMQAVEPPDATQSDVTLVDSRVPGETPWPFAHPSAIGKKVAASEIGKGVLSGKQQTRAGVGRATRADDRESDHLVLARRRRLRRRRRWMIVGTLAGVTLIAVAYWIGSIPPRSLSEQILRAWTALPAWLTDLRPRTATRTNVGSPDADIAAPKQLEDPRVDSTPVGPPVAATPEAEVPARVETPPIDLPPRAWAPRADRAQPPPQGRAKQPQVSPPAPPSSQPPPVLKSPLPALPAEASLEETVAWLTQALREHARLGRLPSGVVYGVDRLEGCNIEWRAFDETGDGFRVKASLISIDADQTAVARRDRGWIVDLPWTDKETRMVRNDSFSGLLVWFPEGETATHAAAAFKRAISLCSKR